MEEFLRQSLPLLGLAPDGAALGRLRLYGDFLEEKNRVMNLTAISGEENIARLHFLDCAAILGAADFKGRSVADVGAGAGFPGLVLKILEPSIALTLLDSQLKRVAFLRELCGLLGFGDVCCLHGRAEELGADRDYRERFDIAVSRAVARLNVLCELCLPLVKPGGLFLAMKGPEAADELSEAQNAVAALGAEAGGLYEYAVPGAALAHRAVLIKKSSSTPTKYPRRFAKIQKNPL